MLDLYLCAAAEAELKSALPSFLNGEGDWIYANHQWALDTIGPVITTPAVMDGEGNITTPAVVDGRFHANLRILNESLAPQVPDAVRITVTNPRRVWA